ncbi:hypothetical protein LPJ59_007118, partial [Coemansia sp. RSA 2399]
METSNPWGRISSYLSTGASDDKHESPMLCCTVESFESPTKESTDAILAATLSIVGRGDDTVLGNIRRRQAIQKDNGSTSLSETSGHRSSMDVDVDKDLWAISVLRSLSETEMPDFSGATRVWQLPHSTLAKLCKEYLDVDGFNGPALAGFIEAAVSSPSVSLENQTLILRHAASSKLFADAKEAIPS